MRALFKYADNRRPDSLANRFRRRRFAIFESLCEGLQRPVRILDVGGAEGFWRNMGVTGRSEFEIVLLNVKPQEARADNVTAIVGDACELTGIGDREFPVVFSNSVIEHVGDREAQTRMASEVRRVGHRYFVQTPNRYFPIEPHFLFPGFQFLPIDARVALVRRFALGYHDAIPERSAALAAVAEIRLLNAAEMRELFPGATIHRERAAGLTKSLIAAGGWGR